VAEFSEREVRFLLDLSRRFAANGIEPAIKQRRLLVGLCRLAGATSGAAALLRDDFSIVGDVAVARRNPQRDHQTNSIAYDTPVNGEALALGADNPLIQPAIREALKHYMCTVSVLPGAPHQRLWHGSHFFRGFLRRLGLEDCILSVVRLPRMKPFMSAVCLSGPSSAALARRGNGSGRHFTLRQRRAIHVAHSGLRWIYYPESAPEEHRMSAPVEFAFPMRSPMPELPPRYQRVLNHLLAGGSEKALADQLGLSRHTIHEYVRAIYRIFNVNSRSELMAHWVEA
jgi:DNA-binding CsgD family transcriptional regulator